MADKKQHTIYRLADGSKVPSVTTVLSAVLSKPALIHWAWKITADQVDEWRDMLGVALFKIDWDIVKQLIEEETRDYRKYRDSAAEIGTLAHSMILADLRNEKYDTDGYETKTIDLAENSFLSYCEWKKQHKVRPYVVERPMVSEIYRYGGTADFYGEIDNTLTVLDFKTGKALYDEYPYQVSAYAQLLIENEFPVNETRLLNIPRTENEKFQDVIFPVIDIEHMTEWLIFRDCLHIYRLKKGE